MKIDSHQHFWLYNEEDFGWIDDSMAKIRHDFLPPQLREELHGMGYGGSIAVQAAQTLHETDFLLELAEQHGEILGVVGWVDLLSPELDAQLEKYAANPKFVGVRHIVQSEPNDFLLREDFQRGISKLARFDLTYDILIYPRQLPAALEFVAKFPDQKFVIDHMAKPFIADCEIEPWATQMHAIAKFPNVYCKLSGMVTEAKWPHWTTRELFSFGHSIIQSFGPSRVMIGSDWPVCLVAGEYREIMEAYESFAEDLSPDERAMVLGRTAKEFYKV